MGRVDFPLYLISDRKQVRAGALEDVVEASLKAGLRAVQLREKDLTPRELFSIGNRFREMTNKYGAKLFINDRVDTAMAVGADGVHLTQNSLPTDIVRRIVGEEFLIGVSTHSLSEAKEAEDGGADFITFGPVYETPSKKRYGPPVGIKALCEVTEKIKIPVFGLGGINTPSKAKEVIDCGAYGIAMISAIISADDVGAKTAEYLKVLER
ncbi:MAG: thiamine phosphate synthase [Nitrospirae bacterium]|nr:MAG: thiamine phosphate synthase [Nitrospirota bacterium]